MEHTDYIFFIVVDIIILAIVLFLFYKKHNRSQVIERENPDIEEFLSNIYHTLSGIEKQLQSLEIDRALNKTINRSDSLMEDYNYIIASAENQLDNSMALIEKLTNLIETENIDTDQLNKLLLIDSQIKTINKVLSKKFIKSIH